MCLSLRDAVPHVAGILLYIGVFMDFEKWLDKNDTQKFYSHFDSKNITIKTVIHEVQNPKTISSHSFMPFIHTTLTFHKYSKAGRKKKDRELYYSSHYDRCIYQYYSYLLNEQYNNKTEEYGINDVAIAYRNNLNKNNIHFAKQAFDFIKDNPNCLIIVGDFEKFFDTLNHAYLKARLCSVLGEPQLPSDYYKVFRSLTKFSYVNFEDILKYYKLDNTETNRSELNHKKIIMPIQVVRKNKSELIHVNENAFGIPQGSAMSAILSNVYMIEFDKMVKGYIDENSGLYLRYSDDSIFVIPLKGNTDSEICTHHEKIRSFISQIPNLVLQSEKTRIYTYVNGTLVNRDSLIGLRTNSKNIIDYLGFSFDGRNISVRDKTITKYYYRAYKKADTIAKRGKISPTGKQISCKNLYRTYSVRGATGSGASKGNFLSYIKRCKEVFGENERVHVLLNTHFGKLKKRINIKEQK